MTADSQSEGGSHRLLIGACGSASVLNLPSYLTTIACECAVKMRVIMTASASVFLPSGAIRLLVDDVSDDAENPLSRDHVGWARWADRFIVLPATAHLLASAAHGSADNFLATTLLAHDQPVTFFPNMNEQMLKSPSVVRNIQTLREDGHRVVIKEVRTLEVSGGVIVDQPGLPDPLSVAKDLKAQLASAEVRPRASGACARHRHASTWSGEGPCPCA